ncbi:MAG TPA: hypothetical protein VE971_01030 [Candidatus Eisenbacteria bacterium]|nr:hypothetical protein [Candidatus Eisenbacteria bacterium]
MRISNGYVRRFSNGNEFCNSSWKSILLGRYKPRSADYKPKRDELHTDEDFKMAYSLQTATR